MEVKGFLRNFLFVLAVCLFGMPQMVLSLTDAQCEDVLRHFDGVEARWLVVDQMADSCPDVSPYVYCEDNPLMYVDPDGRITIKYLNINDPKNAIISKGFDHIPNDFCHQINVCAHGWPKGMNLFYNGKDHKIYSPQEFVDRVLSRNFIWVNRNKNEIITIVLYSCRTADGDNSFAQSLSEYLGDGVVVIAPNQRIYCTEKGVKGVYKAKHVNANNDYLPNHSKERSTQLGEWLVFYKGEVIDRQKGDLPPVVMKSIEMYKWLDIFNELLYEK